MKQEKENNTNMRKKSFIGMVVLFTGLFCSCGDMLDIDSTRVEFEKDNTLDSPNDSLYSFWGILQKVQVIADRYPLFGELRADLVSVTADADTDLRAIADFDFASISDECEYTNISDFYAVINNCNYFIANVDTSFVTTQQTRPLLAEYAAAKAIRAWTYMQMATIYGSVPYYTQPLTSMEEVNNVANDPSVRLDMTGLASKLIDDLLPYTEVVYPLWELPKSAWGGNDTKIQAKNLIMPIDILLGDLYLWLGQYEQAAQHYYAEIVRAEKTVGTSGVSWLVFNSVMNTYWPVDAFSYTFSPEGSSSDISTVIPMSMEAGLGRISTLPALWGHDVARHETEEATDENAEESEIFVAPSLEPSSRCVEISDAQDNGEYAHGNFSLFNKDMGAGDARRHCVYATGTVNGDLRARNSKFEGWVVVYRAALFYLRFAEAVNRMGYPEYAFGVLKYGLNATTLNTMVDEVSGDTTRLALIPEAVQPRDASGAAMFPAFSSLTSGSSLLNAVNVGIHSRGCFGTDMDTDGSLALWNYDAYTFKDSIRLADEFHLTASSTPEDTIAAYQTIVEEMIVDELVLETAWEGNRMFDLMRIGRHRGDMVEFVARTIAMRNGEKAFDNALYNRLKDESNWYLPFK